MPQSFQSFLQSKIWVNFLLPIGFFILLTTFMLWPMPMRMSDSVVGMIGDNVYFIWLVGWFKKALFELHVSPFDIWFLNYPSGWSLAYTEIAPGMLAIAMPFALIGGETLGFNMSMLISFLISGVGAYLWIRHLTGSIAAGLVAGAIFAFLPYRMAHWGAGHLTVIGTQWFPFYLWGLVDLLRLREWSWKPVLLAGISLGLISLTSLYYLYMAILAAGLMLIYYILFIDRAHILRSVLWKHLGAFALVAAPLTVVGILPFIQLSSQGGLPDRDISLLRGYSASLNDFFLPSTDHFLWGQWIGDHFDRSHWIEGTLYIGMVAVVLATLAVIFLRKDPRYRLFIQIFVLVGVCFFILALGTDLHWQNESVIVNLPDFLQYWIDREAIRIRLPGYFFIQYVPFFAKMRALKRFSILLLLSTSLLAGLGSAWLLEKVKSNWRVGLAIVLLGLIFLDFYPGSYTHFTTIQPRPVDLWLADQPSQGAIAQFPFHLVEDQDQTYYTLYHGKPFVGGFFNAFPTEQYKRLQPVMDKFPNAESVATLHELGVHYVLVDMSLYEDFPSVNARILASGLLPLNILGNQAVYTVP